MAVSNCRFSYFCLFVRATAKGGPSRVLNLYLTLGTSTLIHFMTVHNSLKLTTYIIFIALFLISNFGRTEHENMGVHQQPK